MAKINPKQRFSRKSACFSGRRNKTGRERWGRSISDCNIYTRCRQHPDAKKQVQNRMDFQHKSTFVILILEKKAKADNDWVKNLSQFRLENYKMYEWFSSCRERFVENSVESVEIHPKKRRQRWTFARSPQSFQLVEKTGPFYNLYTGLLWKTSQPGNGTDILPGSWQHFFIPGRGVLGGSGKFSGRKNRNSMAKKGRLCYTSRWISSGFCQKNRKLSDAGSVFP